MVVWESVVVDDIFVGRPYAEIFEFCRLVSDEGNFGADGRLDYLAPPLALGISASSCPALCAARSLIVMLDRGLFWGYTNCRMKITFDATKRAEKLRRARPGFRRCGGGVRRADGADETRIMSVGHLRGRWWLWCGRERGGKRAASSR